MADRVKRKQKKAFFRRIGVSACMTASLFFGCTTVWAGDINANEQRVLNYCNQVFTYNGKSYVATEAAKAQAYNKLAADGVDLDKGQADSMILQIQNNVAKGVADGYLVELNSGTSDTETTQTTESSETESTGASEKENTGASEKENTEASERTESSEKESTEASEATGNEEKPAASETAAEPSGNGGTGSSGESGGNNEKPDNGFETEPGETESGTEKKGDNENREGYKNPIKIDIADFIDDVINEGGDYATVVGQDGTSAAKGSDILNQVLENSLFTVSQYKSGTVTMLKEDGTVLFQSSLPIKNTGYHTAGKIGMLLIIMAGLAVLSMAAWRLRHKKGVWLILPASFTVIATLAVVVGGRGLLAAGMADWRTVWIAGAPQYDYTQENWTDTKQEGTAPGKVLRGQQYGKITCEAISLEAPLYYGDDDEIFENGAGTYNGGYLPGEHGTILVGGHDTTYFAPLEKVAEGDILTIDTAYGKYQYQVTKTLVADVTDETAYEITGGGDDAAEEEEKLILYTCYPFGDTETLRNERFYVYAQRISQTESME